jgi:hypothetical protein
VAGPALGGKETLRACCPQLHGNLWCRQAMKTPFHGMFMMKIQYGSLV